MFIFLVGSDGIASSRGYEIETPASDSLRSFEPS